MVSRPVSRMPAPMTVTGKGALMNSEFEYTLRSFFTVLIVLGGAFTMGWHLLVDSRGGIAAVFPHRTGVPNQEFYVVERGAILCINGTSSCFHSFSQFDAKCSIGTQGATSYLIDRVTGEVPSKGYHDIRTLDRKYLVDSVGATSYFIDAETGIELPPGHPEIDAIDVDNLQFNASSTSPVAKIYPDSPADTWRAEDYLNDTDYEFDVIETGGHRCIKDSGECFEALGFLDADLILAQLGSWKFLIDARTGRRLSNGYQEIEVVDRTHFRYPYGTKVCTKTFPEAKLYPIRPRGSRPRWILDESSECQPLNGIAGPVVLRAK